VTPATGQEKPSNHEAALMFEGMVWTQLVQAMRKTIEPSGLFGDSGQAHGTYEYLLDQAVVESAMKASGQGKGLAERFEEALSNQGRSRQEDKSL
jgi:Rod binding domain-containing protein